MTSNLSQGEILIYQTEKGDTKVDVFFEDGTVWLSQKQIALLYSTTPQNVTMHIKNIIKDGELLLESTCKKSLQVQYESTRVVKRKILIYNLDMILAVGYRIRSSVGNQFRSWASSILKEYMQKGFAMNDDRLKNPQRFGQDYFDELLERIRDIRSSEKRFYEKVKAIYALSVDYDSHADSTKKFFANVQNKMIYAVTGLTAAELITKRASAEKDNMGLTNFVGAVVRSKDIAVSKNYLDQKELTALNRIVSMFLDFAEDKADNNEVMTMADWRKTLDGFLTFAGRKVLQGSGTVSHDQMEKYVRAEFKKYTFRRLNMPSDNSDIGLEIPDEQKINK